jgi:hypothetical protein
MAIFLDAFIPESYRLGIFELDCDELEQIPLDTLESNWATFPYPRSTQTHGSDWLRSGRSALLIVPSAAIPEGLEAVYYVTSTILRVRTLCYLKLKKSCLIKEPFKVFYE